MREKLVKYEAARRALAEAHRVDEVKVIRDKMEQVRAYAKLAEDVEMMIWAAEIKIRAERKLGELIPEGKKNGELCEQGDPTSQRDRSSLADLGINYSMSSRAQAIAAIPEVVFEEYIASKKAQREELSTADVLRLSKPGDHQYVNQSMSNEWYTPSVYIEAAREVMGGIDLDPASCEKANETVKAECCFSSEDDGLSQPWKGRMWLNPPYGKQGSESRSGLWSQKLIREYEAGAVEQAVLLIYARTGEGWFAPLWDYRLCFVQQRIKFFDGATGEFGPSPTNGHCLVYLGEHGERFANVFKKFGPVVVESVRSGA